MNKEIKNNNVSLFKEKVVCKNCNNVIFRDLEQYNIYTDTLDKEQKNIYAIFVKEFKCPKCNSTEFNSSICDMSLLADQKPEIINIDLKPKRTRKKINTNL